MSSGLIRREVVEARSRRLEGAVILGAPLRSWVLTAFLSGVVLAAITMAAGTEYTRVTTVRGVLVPTSALVNIVAPRAGVVSNVAVEDAAFVQLHVPLVSIEVQRDSEIGRTPAAQSIAAIERQDSTIRERLKLELSRALTERQRLAAGLAGARAEHAQLLRQVDLQKKVIESAQAEYDRLAKVVSDGIVSKRDYERSLQSLLQEEERLYSLEQQSVANAAQQAQTEAELNVLSVESANRIAEFQGSLAELDKERAVARSETTYLLTAPIAGRVAALQATKGRYVGAGTTLMTIVPERTSLVAELYAPSRAIGFVTAGKPVRISFDAFPSLRFGSYGGVVESVSQTVLMPQDVTAPLSVTEPVYRVRVRLNQRTVQTGGRNIPLQLGMTLTAKIVIERSSVLARLLEPVTAFRN